ncbi:predicted protein [Chaetoceros tenuissimus]|uniref:Uncharacterized protein n=1 Tax=Chaetoceros tenuissimus TaxID=426638 RepID=A0AAD3CQS9_9STRA|nr:predicted protein [Chaetoceros tenuissimus]
MTKQSLEEELLEIDKEALKLLEGTGREDALNSNSILFQRGNMEMGTRQVTSDILKTKVRELFEVWDAMSNKEKTALSNELIKELLDLGMVFVVFHEDRYYGIDMGIDKVHNLVRSRRI